MKLGLKYIIGSGYISMYMFLDTFDISIYVTKPKLNKTFLAQEYW